METKSVPTRAPKLRPPEDPVALMDSWSGFFDRVMEEYRPHGQILFIPSCAGDKPYYLSRSHKLYQRLLDEVAPGRVDKVTLSGLLGPVPANMEDLVAEEYNYNFYLSRYAHLRGQLPQIMDRLTNYMCTFLKKYGSEYHLCISYSRDNYRRVMARVAASCPYPVLVLPEGNESLLGGGLRQLRAALLRS